MLASEKVKKQLLSECEWRPLAVGLNEMNVGHLV